MDNLKQGSTLVVNLVNSVTKTSKIYMKVHSFFYSYFKFKFGQN